MKIVKLVRWGVLALVAFAAMAQTSPQQKQPQNESQVKAIRFDFVFKTVETPNFQSMGTPSAYRADDSWQPTSDQRYREISKDKVSLNQSSQSNHLQVIASFQIKNEGTKKINSIVWEFTDPHFKGDKEIVFTEVKTKLNLAAGETGVLSKRVSSHWPCLTHIDRTKQEQPISRTCGRGNPRTTKSYPADARIMQVNFEDGTMWKMQ
jgi:hypothetical protein